MASRVLSPNSFLATANFLRAGTIAKDVMISLISESVRLLLSKRTLSTKFWKWAAAFPRAWVYPWVKVTSFNSKVPFLTFLKIDGGFSFIALHVSSKTLTASGLSLEIVKAGPPINDYLAVIVDGLLARFCLRSSNAFSFLTCSRSLISSSSHLIVYVTPSKIVSSFWVSYCVASKVTNLAFFDPCFCSSLSSKSASRPLSSAIPYSSISLFSISVRSMAT